MVSSIPAFDGKDSTRGGRQAHEFSKGTSGCSDQQWDTMGSRMLYPRDILGRVITYFRATAEAFQRSISNELELFHWERRRRVHMYWKMMGHKSVW